MHRLSNQKKLAELQASIDALKEKYKEEDTEKEEKTEKSKHPEVNENNSNIKNAISDYLSKIGHRKLHKNQNI